MKKLTWIWLLTFVGISGYSQITETGGNVGIGVSSPESKLHVQTNNVGIKSQYSIVAFEGIDSHLDIISSSGGDWGSSLNFIEGNGSNNTDIWSIARRTSGGGSSLRVNYGINNNHVNSNILTLGSNGNIGIGTASPDYKLQVEGRMFLGQHSSGAGTWFKSSSGDNWFTGLNSNNYWRVFKNGNKLLIDDAGNLGINTDSPESKLHVSVADVGVRSQFGLAVIEGVDAHLDIISSSSGDWGSSLNFIEGDGSSNNDIWSIVRRTSSGNSSLRFNYGSNNNHTNGNIVTFNSSGTVGIGTSITGSHRLAVEGSIGAREIKVEASGWSDFVFEKEYKLRTLEEVEQHIKENAHLPEIPSEEEVMESGINLGEMNAKLLQKIEELTLYMIEQNKRMNLLEAKNAELEKEVSALRNE